MGQTSLPFLNRSGIFSFWNSKWDSKYLYPYFLIKFKYLELLFFKFFKKKFFAIKFLNFNDKVKSSLYYFKNFNIKINQTLFKKSIFKNYICMSKLWVLKFGSWLIFSIYLYDIGVNFNSIIRKNVKKNIKELDFKYPMQIKIFDFKSYLHRNRIFKRSYLTLVFKKFKKFFKIKDMLVNKNKHLYLNKNKIIINFLKFKEFKKKKNKYIFTNSDQHKKIIKFINLKKNFYNKKSFYNNQLINNFYNFL